MSKRRKKMRYKKNDGEKANRVVLRDPVKGGAILHPMSLVYLALFPIGSLL